ncbi:MAG: DUF1800 domain-containing protein [Bacteroidota bacterium]|nr:DUF1800 domain-containing protein [Bacteroidota bacterium]
MTNNQHKIQHLHWRAGFGPRQFVRADTKLEDEISVLLKNSKNVEPLQLKNWDPALAKEIKNMNAEERAAYRKQERQARLQINQDIQNRYAYGSNSLRDKITLFWMGHFACRIANPVFIIKYYNTINNHALGKFSDLLKAMIRNAALLQYLNNNQNRKSNPNENFARELMELFTLGIGNYNETDVKEGARSLTGWGFDRMGEFTIRNEHHDTGIKNFLGEQGNFNGDDIVRIILSNKQCARFITSRIYAYFVNDVMNEKIINELSNKFYASGYDLDALMKNIFTSEWFYDEINTGSQIKSPLVLLTGIIRNFHIKFENPMMPVQLYKILGQQLFDPPNVAGWSGGKSWIDSSTLLYRMRLPELLLQEAESIMAPKDEFDNMESFRVDKTTSRKVKTSFETTGFEKMFATIPQEKVPVEIMNYLLQVAADSRQVQLIQNLTASDNGKEKIFKTAIYVMSLPEYQLC